MVIGNGNDDQSPPKQGLDIRIVMTCKRHQLHLTVKSERKHNQIKYTSSCNGNTQTITLHDVFSEDREEEVKDNKSMIRSYKQYTNCNKAAASVFSMGS